MPAKRTTKRRRARQAAPAGMDRVALSAGGPAKASSAGSRARRSAAPARKSLSDRVLEAVASESPVWVVILIVLPIWAVGLLLTVGPFLDAVPGIDKDFWWHLSTGDWVLDHRAIPTTDPFSWTHGGEEWIAHEWLAGTVIALLWRVGGYWAQVVFTTLVAMFGFWRLLVAARLYGISRRTAALLLLLWGGAYFRVGVIVVRPQVWSWTLLAVLWAELAAYETGRRQRLWLLPPLFAIWINVNLTALIGFGCLGAFLLDRLIRRELNRHLLTIGVLSGLALLATPHHVRLFGLIFSYLDRDAARRDWVLEWMSPRWGDRQNLPFWLALPLVVPAIWYLVRRAPHVWPCAPLLVLAYQSFQSIRYIPVYILLCFVFAGWLSGRYRAYRAEKAPLLVAEPILPRRRWVAATGVGAAAVTLLLAVTVSPSQFRRDPLAWYFPEGAANAFLADYSGKRLFNTYDYGGYLIYRFEDSGDLVSMDGREEMYGERATRRYFYYVAAQPGWQAYFLQQGIDAAIVRRIDPLADALSQDPGWQLVYADDAMLFVRVEPEQERVIGS